VDGEEPMLVVIEIEGTGWDAIPADRVMRNLRRHLRQLQADLDTAIEDMEAGLGRGISQGCEGCEEHGVLEPVIASAAAGLGIQAGAGLPGHGGKAGVGGEFRAGREASAVADLGEDPRAGARADACGARLLDHAWTSFPAGIIAE
jgi:hypothetical protein